jgi:hypothetical protein
MDDAYEYEMPDDWIDIEAISEDEDEEGEIMTFIGTRAEALIRKNGYPCANARARSGRSEYGGTCWVELEPASCPGYEPKRHERGGGQRTRTESVETKSQEGHMVFDAKEAIGAMLDGKVLFDKAGNECWYQSDKQGFYFNGGKGPIQLAVFNPPFTVEKPKQYWTRWEVMDWANSEDSYGWFVKDEGDMEWRYPQYYLYLHDISRYRRARLLSDKSWIDVNTIQRFEK